VTLDCCHPRINLQSRCYWPCKSGQAGARARQWKKTWKGTGAIQCMDARPSQDKLGQARPGVKWDRGTTKTRWVGRKWRGSGKERHRRADGQTDVAQFNSTRLFYRTNAHDVLGWAEGAQRQTMPVCIVIHDNMDLPMLMGLVVGRDVWQRNAQLGAGRAQTFVLNA
jgi:hypothetical protein